MVPNLVITPISSTGRFDVFSGQAATDSVNVIVDVEGYFNSASATNGAQGHYYPLASSRLSDSRCGESPSAPGAACSTENIPAANAQLTTMSAGSTQNVTVAGQGAVPASGAEAAVVQLTATNTSADGYLAVNPTGAAPNLGSNVNFAAGQTTSTEAIVELGRGGAITVHNCCGSTDVVVDVVGYFSDATAALQGGSLYNATTATRLSDSRPANGGLGPIPTNASRAVPVTGNAAVPPGSTSAVISLTEATATAGSYMTVTPNALTPPASTSNVAFGSGDIRANADLATLSGSGGTLSVYNLAGSTDFIVDVFGYFIPAANVPAQGGGGPSPYAGFVGVNSLLIYDSEQYAQASLTTLAAGGIAWDRENFSWGNLEPRPGVWDWAEADALMTAAAKTGTTIRILGLLGHVAPWASADPHPGDNCSSGSPANACWSYPPADPRTLATFAATVVGRYGPGGTFWSANPQLIPNPLAAVEVWNEPWGYWDWLPNPDPAAYAQLFIGAANAIHQADAGMPVLMPGDLNQVTTAPGVVLPWLSTVLADIHAAGYDPASLAQGLSVHPYPAPSNLSPLDNAGPQIYTYSRVDLVHQAEMAAGDNIPLWVTEMGVYTCDAGSTCPQGVSPAVQAQYLTEEIQMARTTWASYVANFFVYGYNSGNMTPDNYDIKGTPAWTCVTTLIASGTNQC
ncbi:MAG: hypothetical protein ACR2MN_17705 [Acidimicrobiales bacterium]